MFDDPDGLLSLSKKQSDKMKGWFRTHILFPKYNPRSVAIIPVADYISGYEIRQNSVGDCSVVCSLAVAAHYEYKSSYKKRIISSLIYPQDQYGNPIYNPSGKYVVRLFVNGFWRQVTIDDKFPAISNKELLCASSKDGKLWVSILEKAYLKVRGGYDFQGSISSMDLYAYTSWMPERVHLKVADRESLWKKISSGSAMNDCMIIISTGDIDNEEKIGLKSNHAYAVLEVIEMNGIRILLVKNPWGKFRWTGKFSTEDKLNWTEPLKKSLHYYELEKKDTGIFWIDFDSVVDNFDVMDINWNPEPLIYRNNIWDIWDCAKLDKSDYNLFTNPQYAIEFSINPMDNTTEVLCWIILTKIPLPDEATWSCDDFMGLSAYMNQNFGKISYDENAINELKLTNSNHYLLKAVISKDNLLLSKYVNLVLRQHYKTGTFQYKYCNE